MADGEHAVVYRRTVFTGREYSPLPSDRNRQRVERGAEPSVREAVLAKRAIDAAVRKQSGNGLVARDDDSALASDSGRPGGVVCLGHDADAAVAEGTVEMTRPSSSECGRDEEDCRDRRCHRDA